MGTDNFNFEDNLQNCFYIKKLGSNTHPKIYLDVKQSGRWIVLDKYIGDYKDVVELIANYRNQFICIRGFSRVNICQLIRMCNELKETNIMPIEFNNKISLVQYERHMMNKEQILENLKKELQNYEEMINVEQYIKMSNKVLKKDKYKSRVKVMKHYINK